MTNLNNFKTFLSTLIALNPLKCFLFQQMMPRSMIKLQLTRLNLGRVFNYRCRHASTQISTCTSSKQPNLLLKTQPKQVFGYLPLAFVLPAQSNKYSACINGKLENCIFFLLTHAECKSSWKKVLSEF